MVKRKVHEPGKRSLRAFLCTCVTAAFVLVGTNAFALSGKLGETGMIDVDTTLNYDVNWRRIAWIQSWRPPATEISKRAPLSKMR